MSGDVAEIVEEATIAPLAMSDAEQEVIAAVATEDQPLKFKDFDNLDPSTVMDDMPNATSLFKAIINKSDDESETSIMESALSSTENNFRPRTSVRMVEEEPELFPEHASNVVLSRRQEEPEKLIVSADEEEHIPTFIERVTGFSIAKRNRKKLKETERVQEPISPSFSDADFGTEDRLNLEIPSFLRRR